MDISLTGQRLIELEGLPESERSDRLQFIALNQVSALPNCVSNMSRWYPYLPIKRYWDSKAEHFRQLAVIEKKEKRPANIRLDTYAE